MKQKIGIFKAKTKQNSLRSETNLPSSNSGQKCRNPVFMRASGIRFIEWLYFGSICERSNDLIKCNIVSC